MEKFIRSILARMSTADKIRLAYGRSNLSIGKLEKYGIREVFMADGPQGIRRENGEKNTALPCGIALAASFDVRLAEEYGAVIGEEARACGIRASLGPGVNLMRTPLNGRSLSITAKIPSSPERPEPATCAAVSRKASRRLPSTWRSTIRRSAARPATPCAIRPC